MTLSISRPDSERSERPNALTTPAVTLYWKPKGLPIAIASWPTRIFSESPRGAVISLPEEMRMTATSVPGSSPTIVASNRRPSLRVTAILSAPWTTWLLVRTKPSGVKTKPEPLPLASRRPRAGAPPGWRNVLIASMKTTEGLIRSAVSTTARE